MKVLLISHSSGLKGPIDFFEDFLLSRNFYVIKLEHPLDNYKNKHSILYENKVIKNRWARKNFSFVNLLIDLVLSISIVIKYSPGVVVGANNFDTLSGLMSKLLGKRINKIIYFGSDFSEKRFNNIILDKIYMVVERVCLSFSNQVISNTNRALRRRLSLGLKKKKGLVIPNGVYLKRELFVNKNINKNKFIYVGNLTPEHGLFLFINELKSLISEIVIIGQGEDWERVKNLVKASKIPAKFYFRRDHDFVIRYLQGFEGIGLAPYELTSPWVFYSSPLKIKEYISCGVPVIMSSVVEDSEVVKNNNLGIVYKQIDNNEIQSKLDKFDANDYNVKAKKFYNKYRYDNLYKKIKI